MTFAFDDTSSVPPSPRTHRRTTLEKRCPATCGLRHKERLGPLIGMLGLGAKLLEGKCSLLLVYLSWISNLRFWNHY